MKVLITTDAYLPMVNGVVTSVMNLISELTSLGHEVRVIALAQDNHSCKKGDTYYIRSFGVKFYPNARATLAYHSKYIKEILEWHPDIIHTQTEFCTFFFALLIAHKLDLPIVHTYHTLYEDYTSYFTRNESLGHLAVAKLSKELSHHVETLIAPTEKVKSILKSYEVACPIEVIPTGLDLAQFEKKISREEWLNLRASLGIVPENQVVLTVGRLGKEKNIDELLENMSALLKEDGLLRLLIIGDGPYRSELENKAMALSIEKQVIFTGMLPQEKIYAYYQLGDIFVSASTSETQGLTYIEALASGLPVVCKKDESLTGVLKNGENGYSYETEDVFHESIKKLLENHLLWLKLSEAAQKNAQKYSKVQFGISVATLYEKVIQNHLKGQFYENDIEVKNFTRI